MRISVIFPYTLKFGDHATGYEASLRQHEPEVEIVKVCTDGEADYRYTAALNAGARQATGDWLLFSNDDVLCQGKFADMVEKLDRGTIYGMELRQKNAAEWGADVNYLYGWILLMHRDAFNVVGPFEEFYLHAGFDDIDYCWRAQRLGFGLAVAPLPFVHLADQPGSHHRRYTVPGYKEQMARSKKYFIGKINLLSRGYTDAQASEILAIALAAPQAEKTVEQAFAELLKPASL